MRSDEWYTPAYVFDALDVWFDMDVAHPGWDACDWTPTFHIVTANSLTETWVGFVWMNAPFGARNGLVPWLDKFFEHGDGVALAPDRTSAPWWQSAARRADSLLFVSPKVHFVPGPGVTATSPADGVTLFAIGENGCRALRNAEANGLGVRV